MYVSIIIVSYNNFDYLKKCLNSIVKFTNGITYEIIIVDNSSTEGMITDVIENFNNIILIQNKENKGFAVANNQGLKIAKGKYCLLLNNDTKLVSNVIKDIFNFAESLDTDSIIGCQLLNKDGTKQESIIEFPNLINIISENFMIYKLLKKSKIFNKYYKNSLIISKPIKVDVVKGAFLFIKTSEFKILNGFDERFFFYSEEVDLCYRYKRKFKKDVQFYPLAEITHYGGLELNPNNWFAFKNISIGKIQFYQKHFNKIKLIIILISHYLGLFLRAILFLVLSFFQKNELNLQKSKNFLRLLTIYPKNKFK